VQMPDHDPSSLDGRSLTGKTPLEQNRSLERRWIARGQENAATTQVECDRTTSLLSHRVTHRYLERHSQKSSLLAVRSVTRVFRFSAAMHVERAGSEQAKQPFAVILLEQPMHAFRGPAAGHLEDEWCLHVEQSSELDELVDAWHLPPAVL